MDKIFNLGRMVEKEEHKTEVSRVSEFRKRFAEINSNLDSIQDELDKSIDEIRNEINTMRKGW